jgi:hypothetical protein
MAGRLPQVWVFSPDGRQFVFMRAKPGAGPVPDRNQSGALFVEVADGTGLHQITPYGLANSHDNATENWSPNGNEILFAGVHGPFAGAGLYVVHTDGTGLRAIPLQIGSRSFAFTPRWSPDGSKIIFSLFTTTAPEPVTRASPQRTPTEAASRRSQAEAATTSPTGGRIHQPVSRVSTSLRTAGRSATSRPLASDVKLLANE